MPHGAFHGSARAYLRSSPLHDRPFKGVRCNHQNNQTVSLLKTILKLLPVHSDTDIPKDICAQRRKFQLKASNKSERVYISRPH